MGHVQINRRGTSTSFLSAAQLQCRISSGRCVMHACCASGESTDKDHVGEASESKLPRIYILLVNIHK